LTKSIHKIKLINDIFNLINTNNIEIINIKNNIKIKNDLYISGIKYNYKNQEIYIITIPYNNIQWFFKLEYFDENILEQIIYEIKKALIN
jgi:hypothetical protein